MAWQTVATTADLTQTLPVRSTTLETLLATALQRKLVDASGNLLTSSLVGSKQALDANITNASLSVAVSNPSLTVSISNPSLSVAVSNASLNVAVSNPVTVANSNLNVSVTNKAFGTGTPASITLPTANVPVKILSANANRRYAYVSNYSGASTFLQLGSAAAANTGILVATNGFYEITGNNLWTGDVWAIFASNNRALQVFEGTA